MSKPFEVMEWGTPEQPTQERLDRILARDGLKPEAMQLAPGKTQEMKFDGPVVYVLVSGALYVGLPGYGSVDLAPGDILEIQPGILHDITVTGHQVATLLQAHK